jgi:hypothetical protein
MKNKPYPALLGGSYLFIEIKKRTPKSRETIPLGRVLADDPTKTTRLFSPSVLRSQSRKPHHFGGVGAVT